MFQLCRSNLDEDPRYLPVPRFSRICTKNDYIMHFEHCEKAVPRLFLAATTFARQAVEVRIRLNFFGVLKKMREMPTTSLTTVSMIRSNAYIYTWNLLCPSWRLRLVLSLYFPLFPLLFNSANGSRQERRFPLFPKENNIPCPPPLCHSRLNWRLGLLH